MGEVTRGARGLLVCPEIRGTRRELDAAERQDEAVGLAQAIGIEVVGVVAPTVRQVQPATLFGSGQVSDLRTRCEQDEAELVVVDGSLTPIQQRNLETALERKVIDRTGLILEIFGERAVTAEGRLQVELAHLDYQQSRLVRSWTHLERQRGGFGFLGGPGETQIEADRRMIRQRMARLRKELEQVRRTRQLHRQRRTRAPWPVVSLVGYTNAGKSTLFNRLTGAEVLAQDMLFATLDPAMRAISLPGVAKVVLSDTVGFISDLPTELVAAFRATLEEVLHADVICHVRDIASPTSSMQKAQVEAILSDLGVMGMADDDEGGGAVQPVLEIWNKWDLVPDEDRAELRGLAASNPDVVIISALDGEGCEDLQTKLAALLTRRAGLHRFVLDSGRDGRRIAWLHAHGEVVSDEPGEGEGERERHIAVRLNPQELGQFRQL